MCLIDAVLDWDAGRVRCLSSAHRSPTNPLRANDRLAAVCGIEFAAQAVAIHGALLAPQPPGCRAGYLAGVRGVALNVARLDDVQEDLLATASRAGGDDSTLLYDFALAAGTRVLLSGRAIIVVSAASAAPPQLSSST